MTHPSRKPPSPWLANRLLEAFCRPDLYEEVRGDLEEAYQDHLARLHPVWARLFYGVEVLFFLRAHVLRRAYSYEHTRGPIMWSNYVKVALRILRRHKGYALLNLSGLAAGMACCLLILLFVQDELRYDRHHEKADQIYRLARNFADDEYEGIAKVNGPWGPTAAQEIPEVEQMTRFVFFGQTLVQRGETRAYEGGGFLTDSTVFQVFDIPLLQGDSETALVAPNSVVLGETLARAYFGSDDPLGQTLVFDNQNTYTVTGVMRDWPTSSHFTARFLASMSGYTHPRHDDWIQWNQYYTYLLLQRGADPEVVEAKVAEMLRRHLEVEIAADNTPMLQPLTAIHLHSNLFREMQANGDIAYVYLFSALAFFILLIACVNFMNLSTARAANRAREVGMRKVAGARRGALMQQFLGESVLLSGIAVLLALVLLPLLLPTFNQLAGKNLAVQDLYTGRFLVGLFVTVGFVGLVAGSYPAFVLSGFRPAQVLKGAFKVRGKARLREGLVVFQFAISAALIMATGILYHQLDYIQHKDLGFDKEQIVTLPIRDPSLNAQHETIKQTLMQHPGVLHASISGNAPGGGDWGLPYRPEGIADEDRPPMRVLAVDLDFLDTYRMEIARGRGFSRDFSTDATGAALLLNEEAARQLGWEEPMGKTIDIPIPVLEPTRKTVVGVVKDFHFRSMREQIAPILFFIPPPDWYGFFSVKIQSTNIDETLAFLEAQWTKLDPAHPFTYAFFDQGFDQLHRQEERLGQLVGYFTLLALLIACLGLFGLASFRAQQRTKEIGVRKVLGASVPGIVMLLSKEFTRLVLVALVVAGPLAYFVMDRWLQNFAYQVEISWWIFLIAGLAALVIAWLTVSYQAFRAATANPIKALRYE